MNPLRFIPLIAKQVLRHRVRTVLTVGGIAVAMFLFTVVQAMQRGVAEATRVTADDTRLIVYRAARFCPMTSKLPEDYGGKIAALPGVERVVPTMVRVSNCRTSLDVVTYRGVPKRAFLDDRGDGLSIVAGDTSAWLARTDAALVGKTLADRRGLRPGDTFDAAGITTHVAAIFDANNPGDQNVAYTALEFVQLAGRDELGIVTQFEVEVTDAGQLEPVAAAIDELFAVAQEPTQTYTVQAFVGRVAGDVIELVNFAGWLGLGCLAAVLALVGNAIVLGVQSRVAEHAVLQTLGYTGRSIAVLIVGEGVLLALIGGLVGGSAAVVVAYFGAWALSVDGQSILIRATPGLVLVGLVTCGALGVVAGLVPAWQASRRPIAACFRTT